MTRITRDLLYFQRAFPHLLHLFVYMNETIPGYLQRMVLQPGHAIYHEFLMLNAFCNFNEDRNFRFSSFHICASFKSSEFESNGAVFFSQKCFHLLLFLVFIFCFIFFIFFFLSFAYEHRPYSSFIFPDYFI